MRHFALVCVAVFIFYTGCSKRGKKEVSSVDSGERVLVIVNSNSSHSQAIGNYYVSRRRKAKICYISAPVNEEISRTDFNNLKAQVENFLTANNLKEEIFYIVTTSDVPLKVASAGGSEDFASVDSELALLFTSYNINGKVPNPYYNSNSRFNRTFNIYLVCRLTGYETDSDGDGIADDVKGLIDRGFSPVRHPRGLYVLDVDPAKDGGAYQMGNDWLRQAGTALVSSGFNTILDTTNTFLTYQNGVVGYSSWGSNDSSNTTAPYRPYNAWAAGAVAVTFVSTNARSFKTGTSYGQCLLADYVKEGVTGIAGHTYEPYLDACCRPPILFDRYTKGFNLAESFYCAMPYLSWQTVVVGDPLCAPYR
ncbi:MAG: TIGR03790 family protein [Planctomycetota bacterium]|nr:TIGR03790 family protein [Planctomycetota bacterium]